ncbi:MAG: MAPEG family protein [Alphaproteobacteria bacterium]|nr:MAPEG family protein [Alphaproteobacteria bacterium]
MTIPLWCLVVACFLPYLWVPFTAKDRTGMEGGFDNDNPREQQAKLTGQARRALGAHQNSFEALPLFTVGVLVTHITGADPDLTAALAITWVVARIIYGFIYISGKGNLRTAIFSVGLLANAGMFVLAGMA